MKNTREATYDLKTQEGRCHVSVNEYVCQPIKQHLLTGKESKVVFGSVQVFLERHRILFLDKRKVFALGFTNWDVDNLQFADGSDPDDLPSYQMPSAMVIDIPKHLREEKHGPRFTLLLNGDEDQRDSSGNNDDDLQEVSIVSEVFTRDMPTISFLCLHNFYSTNSAISRINVGKLRVIDYTLDETIQLTTQQKKMRDGDKAKLKPPKAGFTLVHHAWHRAGSVLLWDEEKNLCILQGQDEGTYFGVELPKKVRTISEAFEALVPKEVRGKSCVRQGEWFIVNVKEKEVPAKKDSVLLFDNSGNNSFFLPIESEESNRHWISSRDGRVSKDGKLFAHSPRLEHDQHMSAHMDGWCRFYKNTAVRSFSQEGVD